MSGMFSGHLIQKLSSSPCEGGASFIRSPPRDILSAIRTMKAQCYLGSGIQQSILWSSPETAQSEREELSQQRGRLRGPAVWPGLQDHWGCLHLSTQDGLYQLRPAPAEAGTDAPPPGCMENKNIVISTHISILKRNYTAPSRNSRGSHLLKSSFIPLLCCFTPSSHSLSVMSLSVSGGCAMIGSLGSRPLMMMSASIMWVGPVDEERFFFKLCSVYCTTWTNMWLSWKWAPVSSSLYYGH